MRYACRAGVDDWASEPRYQTMLHTLQAKADGMDIPGAMALLAAKKGFFANTTSVAAAALCGPLSTM